MAEVPRTVTPITRQEAADLLIKHFPAVDRETAALLLALMFIETGGGLKAIQHNPGNVTAKEDYPTLWRPPWYEVTPESADRLRKLHELMLKGRAPKAFRAYPSWDAGMDDWVGFLRVNYEPLLAAASTGDVPTFRAELARKYAADYTPAHDRGLTQLRDSFRPLVSSQPAPQPHSAPFDLSKIAMLYLTLKGLG